MEYLTNSKFYKYKLINIFDINVCPITVNFIYQGTKRWLLLIVIIAFRSPFVDLNKYGLGLDTKQNQRGHITNLCFFPFLIDAKCLIIYGMCSLWYFLFYKKTRRSLFLQCELQSTSHLFWCTQIFTTLLLKLLKKSYINK